MRLISFLPNPDDATSYYRGAWPLRYLKKHIKDIDLEINPSLSNQEGFSHSTIIGADCVFLQRPCNRFHLHIANAAKEMGIPLWIDYDDDLFAVSPDNPTFSIYSNQDTRNQMMSMILMADAVSVSTKHLKENIEKSFKGKRVVHIPNAFDDYGPLLSRRKTNISYSGNSGISWRGSLSHMKDLLEYSGEIWEFARKNPDIEWSFFGNPGWIISSNPEFKNCKHYQHRSILQYIDALKLVAPKVNVVPLSDSPFNRAKSNIAWIEATYAGAMTVAPQWPSWEEGRVWSYQDKETFYSAIDCAINTTSSAHKFLIEDDWSYILSNLSLSKINLLRVNLLSELANNA